jgi:methanogenic corrinoid protein MtbC1/DNA-binding CsgD family transcriptional regulator
MTSDPSIVTLLEQRYEAALTEGDEQAAFAVVDDAVATRVRGSQIHTDVIAPALVRIGELWEQEALTVADEHLASEITTRALVRLVGSLRCAPPSSREEVLLAAVEGERHVIGLRMVADLLDGAGYRVLFLGADVPTDALVAAIGSHDPVVTALGCTLEGPALVEALAAIATADLPTRVLLGGAGVPEWLRGSGYPWLNRSDGVVEEVESMLASPSPPVPPARLLGRRPGGARGSRRPTRGGGPDLTPRQTQVLRGLSEGKSTDQIAGELFLTPVTVRNHIANILAALGVHSRLQAVVAARRRGLIE